MNLGGSNNTNILPGRGLINPAFVIKIVSATDDMQQKNNNQRRNPNNDYLSNLSIGDTVDFKKGKIEISGNINRIIKNSSGDVIYVIVIDETGKTHKVEATDINPYKKFKDNKLVDKITSTPGVFNENRFLSFSNFTK